MAAFSMDLRQRICDELNRRDETGDTIEEIAERFQVSRQWIFKLRQRLAHEQTLDPTDPCAAKEILLSLSRDGQTGFLNHGVEHGFIALQLE
jgi:transposase-like protein